MIQEKLYGQYPGSLSIHVQNKIQVMSEEEIFMHSLEQDIQKSKPEQINVSVVALRENENDEISFIDKIVKEDIIRKTKNYKEYSFTQNGKKYYYCYSVDMDSFVFDFEIRKLETYIKTIKDENPECDLEYSAVLIPRDSSEIDEIKLRLNNFSKGDM